MTEPSCRPGCAACCIAPSISSPMPLLPRGKPAGLACPHLDPDMLCSLYGQDSRPRVCSSLKADPEMCRSSREEALAYLERLERETAPGTPFRSEEA
jgi:Fe-S-cluster containining protein